MEKRELEVKRKAVMIATLLIIFIVSLVFIANPATRNVKNFFGFSTMIIVVAMVIASVWLEEDIWAAIDMPGLNFRKSPINVILHIPFFIFIFVYAVLQLWELIAN